jgi:5-(carboxyamino)imidazole ribonucleotide mutase
MSVAIVMGSDSDVGVMRQAAEALDEFGVPWEMRVLSAHRTPDDTIAYSRSAVSRGIGVVIAGAGGAAHLPGVIAATTTLPVIGVPIALKNLDGLDSLLSIAQMPKGIPVATVAVDGARNAGLLAVRILALADESLRGQLDGYVARMADEVRSKDAALQSELRSES